MRQILPFLILVIVNLSHNYSFAQRAYGNSTNDDYVVTNTNYFCIPNTVENQVLNTPQKDFYSTMRYAQVMSQVSKDGRPDKPVIIGNVEISLVKFAQFNTGILQGQYIKDLKMIILKPLETTITKRPLMLISIGGDNANLSEYAFLTTVTQYLMKGYVVAYFENPRKNEQNLLAYLASKQVNNQLDEIYRATLYLGVQVGNAAAKYMAYHSNDYNIDPNNFYGMGQSYGAFIISQLGLGKIDDYYENGQLKYPFRKLGVPDLFLNAAMRQANFKMKAMSMWAHAYHLTDGVHENPFGELIDSGDNIRTIHFHGLQDNDILYHSGWSNQSENISLYCSGVKDVIPRFQAANLDYLAFVICNGAHSVLDTTQIIPLPRKLLSTIIDSVDFYDIPSSYNKLKPYMDGSYYLFTQGTNIADLTAQYFQNKVDLNSIPTINYITPISDTNGNFKNSDCMDQGYCIKFDKNIGDPCDDGKPCTKDDKIQLDCNCRGMIDPSFSLGITTTIIGTSCGLNNGSIICIDKDTFNEYKYTWSNGQTGKAIHDLSPGLKTLTVCSACDTGDGCIETHTFDVGGSSPITAIVTPINTKCGLHNGSATVIAAGGGDGHQYHWSNGQTNPAIIGLAPGNYAVTVNSTDQCPPLILSINIATSTELTTTLETVHTSCGKDNGRVSAMSNHPNLTYRWNTGSFSAFINNLSAGTYTVTVTDVDGCQDTAITEINNSTGFDTGIVINENKLVANQNDVSYQWIDCENNTYLQGAVYQSFNPSRDGNYSVELKGIDINGNECVEITDCVNFELSSSTEEKMFWNKVKIPTIIHDELNIQLSTLSLVSKIYIKNMSGYSMTIDAKNVDNNISIDLVTLPSGMYFIVFENNGERFVKKIIKI